MAFNWQTFRVRTISSLVFVAVMLTGICWNQWSFLALFSIIHFGCWWEYLGLIEKIYKARIHTYVKLGLMCMGYGLMLYFWPYPIGGYNLKESFSLPITAAGFAILLIGIFQKTPIGIKSFFGALAGLIYISLSWGLMLDLYKSIDVHLYDTFYVIAPYFIPVLIVFSIWINDTMAYVVGSLIGKTPLTSISPKKTWEGTIGGIILSVIIMALLFPLAFYSMFDITFSIFTGIIALIASFTGTFGDLLESKLKRMAGVKDSGSIMPGHGGFMDRFDSLLLAVPFVWFYVRLSLS